MSRCPLWCSPGVALAALALLGACAAPPAKPTPEPAPVLATPEDSLDPTLGLLVRVGAARLQIPKGWRLYTEGRHTWESGAQTPGATLHVQQRPGRAVDETWSQHWEALSAQYHRRAGHIQSFLREEALSPPRAESGWLFVIQRSEQDRGFVLYQALLGAGDHLYIITAAVPQEHFPALEDTLERVVASLRPDPF